MLGRNRETVLGDNRENVLGDNADSSCNNIDFSVFYGIEKRCN